MSRGSRVERSAEEREQARQERARRRAEREHQPLPPLEEQPPSFDAGAPGDHVAGNEEHAVEAADAAELAAEQPARGPAQHDPTPDAGPDAARQQPDVPAEPQQAGDHAAPELPATHFEPPAAAEAPLAGVEPAPPAAEGPAGHEPPARADAPLQAEAPASPQPEALAPIPSEPLPHPADAPRTEELAAVEPAAAEEEPQPAAPPPPIAGATASRGARRKAATGGDGGRLPPLPAAARSPLGPRRRSPGARVGAIVALALVVVAAVVVLIVSSSSKGKSPSSASQPVLHVIIPEGYTRLQIAQHAARLGLTGNYRTASKHSQLLDPTRYGAPPGTADLEGFLFPATYDLLPKAPVTSLVEKQLIAFKEEFGAKEIARAKALNITPYQLLIVASMVEREAQVPGDRPKIAAVIYNRLHAGMPLGIDATLYYAIEIRGNIPTYTGELTESQLHMNSRYNTRTHVGLPPTPIANPGMASIEAAGRPAHASYLYYVLAPDGCGEHVFSTSEAQFQANAAAYQAALRKNGGHPPACKKG